MTVTVVVAEDEAIIRMNLVEVLTEEGYEVVGQCGRGDEAVELVTSLRPDVAILDIKMPAMSGIDAARLITGETTTAVIMLTAFSQRELIHSASDAGAMAYLTKPYERQDLVPAVELALVRAREAADLRQELGAAEQRLVDRKLIDRAKGRLIDEFEMSEADAFSFLQRNAMSGRRSMAAVAGDVLSGVTTP